MTETSTRPYLIRAIHEWCSDNGYRPFIAVMVDEHTVVPREFVRDGEIVLNVSTGATNRLRLGNDLIEFEARFSGVVRQVSVPVECVSAIYAAENGHGMAFDVSTGGGAQADDSGEVDAEAVEASVEAPAPAEAPRGAPSRGKLSSVPAPADAEPAATSQAGTAPRTAGGPALSSVPATDSGDKPPTEPPPSPGGRPKLTRIK